MNAFQDLDPVVQDLATCLAMSVDGLDWSAMKLSTRVAPASEICAQECTLTLLDGKIVEGWYPENNVLDHLRKRARDHLKLTQDLGQPRWYKMIVTVERSGKFSVDFEYKDDYQEGDIMKRG